jgi:hypothetical protein
VRICGKEICFFCLAVYLGKLVVEIQESFVCFLLFNDFVEECLNCSMIVFEVVCLLILVFSGWLLQMFWYVEKVFEGGGKF